MDWVPTLYVDDDASVASSCLSESVRDFDGLYCRPVSETLDEVEG